MLKEKALSFIRKKKKATAALTYLMILISIIFIVLLSVYVFEASMLAVHQHAMDDALADSATAALIADQNKMAKEKMRYARTNYLFKDVNNSYRIFTDCMNTNLSNEKGSEGSLFSNIKYDRVIFYEVSPDTVTSYEFNANGVLVNATRKPAGSVFAPTGQRVTTMSCYAKASFEIHSTFSNYFKNKTRKSRNIYVGTKKYY